MLHSYLFLGEPSSSPNPILSCSLFFLIMCFSLIVSLISLKREARFCWAGGLCVLGASIVLTQSPTSVRWLQKVAAVGFFSLKLFGSLGCFTCLFQP